MSSKVASKKSPQSVFTRAVKNVKKRQNFIKLDDQKNEIKEKVKVKTPVPTQVEDESRGVVYLSHIPPGFYENEIRKYFNQFGHVTRIKVGRSKKTGKSKGHAFIEFRYAEVAKVVAETMNNYLMSSRLLKASFMDKKYSNTFWKPVTPKNCPTVKNRRRDIMIKNCLISPSQELQYVKNRKKKLGSLLEKLKAKGIDYDFKPSDDTSLEMGESKAEPNFIQDDSQTPESMILPVFEVDESDNEINFKTPPNVIKRVLKSKNSPVEVQTPLNVEPEQSGPKKKRKNTLNHSTVQTSNKKSSRVLLRGKGRIPVLRRVAGSGKVKSKKALVKTSKKKV